jgi:hypothetical protein
MKINYYSFDHIFSAMYPEWEQFPCDCDRRERLTQVFNHRKDEVRAKLEHFRKSEMIHPEDIQYLIDVSFHTGRIEVV